MQTTWKSSAENPALIWSNRSESFSKTRLALKSENAAIAASRNSPFLFS
ncbi:hypothetical protein SAMN04490185_3946 [Pseudomonas frederiksbergensis]|uniref:Uncharacterized protein n=1 Tax=Pseudomonas frederiksbergensis TaxID=104087 RepID=A0A1H5CMR9_9PSED|nr:hypothetical protein SAMN04490185_3946 [Pseudomonas frederiksbergensis]